MNCGSCWRILIYYNHISIQYYLKIIRNLEKYSFEGIIENVSKHDFGKLLYPYD